MRRRKVAFTLGQYGEELAVQFFKSTPGCPNLQAASTGTAKIDAISRKGDRYSIKTICSAKKTGAIYPDAKKTDEKLFDYLLVVKVGPDWALECIYEFSWDQFVECRSWDTHMNAWYVSASIKKLSCAKRYTVAA